MKALTELEVYDVYAAAVIGAVVEHPENREHDCAKVANWVFDAVDALMEERARRMDAGPH